MLHVFFPIWICSRFEEGMPFFSLIYFVPLFPFRSEFCSQFEGIRSMCKIVCFQYRSDFCSRFAGISLPFSPLLHPPQIVAHARRECGRPGRRGGSNRRRREEGEAGRRQARARPLFYSNLICSTFFSDLDFTSQFERISICEIKFCSSFSSIWISSCN